MQPHPAQALSADVRCWSWLQGTLTDPATMGSTTLQQYWTGLLREPGFTNWSDVAGAAVPLVPASSPYAHW